MFEPLAREGQAATPLWRKSVRCEKNRRAGGGVPVYPLLVAPHNRAAPIGARIFHSTMLLTSSACCPIVDASNRAWRVTISKSPPLLSAVLLLNHLAHNTSNTAVPTTIRMIIAKVCRVHAAIVLGDGRVETVKDIVVEVGPWTRKTGGFDETISECFPLGS